jgi:hypothetical protein
VILGDVEYQSRGDENPELGGYFHLIDAVQFHWLVHSRIALYLLTRDASTQIKTCRLLRSETRKYRGGITLEYIQHG